MKPKVGTKGHVLNRILRVRGGLPGGTSAYWASFERIPAWCLPEKGIVGVYENVAGAPERALLFFEDRVTLLAGVDVPVWTLPFRDISRVLPFSKNPLARELIVETGGGLCFVVPVKGQDGDVTVLARALYNVIGAD